MRTIKYIFIHCSASSQKLTIDGLLAEFRRKGWKNPGYHYAITPDGKVHQLLDVSEVANGVKGYNSVGIHVAYIGGIDSKAKATDNRTEAQKKALREMVAKLHGQYPTAQIMGHRDIWGTNPAKWQKMCPCFDVRKEYADIING